MITAANPFDCLRNFPRDGAQQAVLIVGAHPDEAYRFEPAFQGRKIFYWNFDYLRNGEIPEKFVAGPVDSHIFADFNDSGVLKQFEQAAAGLFSEIWFDNGVFCYTRWTKEPWKCLLNTLKLKGKLIFDMKFVGISTCFSSTKFYQNFPEKNQGRKLGWSHTKEDLAALFCALLPQEEIVLDAKRMGEIEGYFTYVCKNPSCTADCLQAPKIPACLVSIDQSGSYVHDEKGCKGECKEPQAFTKTCSHDQHQCEGVCVVSRAIYQEWDDLLKAGETDFFPQYIAFVQQFLGKNYVVQAYDLGYPFKLNSQQDSEEPTYLVQITSRLPA